MSQLEEAVTIFVGNIVHCVEPFSAHTLEKGFVIVRGSQVRQAFPSITSQTTKKIICR